MTDVDTTLDQSTRPVVTEGGDHERFAHYVPRAQLNRALVTGEAVIALCGKRWVPHRDPERFPVCPTCKEIKAARSAG